MRNSSYSVYILNVDTSLYMNDDVDTFVFMPLYINDGFSLKCGYIPI